MLKKLTLVAFAVLALAAFSACDDGGWDEGAKGPDTNIGTLDGTCKDDGTCDTGLACNAYTKICMKVFVACELGCPDGFECVENECVEVEAPNCPEGCLAGYECIDNECVDIPAPETKKFGDACASTSECGENLACADNKCAWDPGFVIPFADAKLKQAVIDAIKTTDPAYSAMDVKVADCQKLPKVEYESGDGTITELVALDASNKDITDVAGIQYCSNLQALNLWGNQLTSLPADIFTGLTSLQKLYLGYNKISDISALSGLTKLTYLNLLNDPIVDLAPLFKIYKDGGLPKGSTLKINNFTDSYANKHTLNILKADGVDVITTQ